MIIDSSVERFTPQTVQKNISIRSKIDKNQYALTGRLLLGRIVNNLIDNAIKYTLVGEIVIGSELVGNHLCLWIKDSGAGMSSEHLKLIFNEFYQIPSNNTLGYSRPGLGLGLSIVSRIVQVLGAEISVESELGRGSIFKIMLPNVDDRESTESVNDIYASYDVEVNKSLSLVVMVVDDEEYVRESMKLLLESWQCIVYSAFDEESATSVLGQHLKLIDIVIMDYRLANDSLGVDVAYNLETVKTTV